MSRFRDYVLKENAGMDKAWREIKRVQKESFSDTIINIKPIQGGITMYLVDKDIAEHCADTMMDIQEDMMDVALIGVFYTKGNTHVSVTVSEA